MKKLTLALSIALLASAACATNASAQRYDARIDVARTVDPEREFRRGGDWGRRTRAELDRLEYEVRQVRAEIGNLRDGRIRERFHRVRRATDRLNYAFDRGMARGWEVRRRADEIRAELWAIRRELRARYGGGRGGPWR